MRILFAMSVGFLLDLLFGDPAWLPHPVVAMGRVIDLWERRILSCFPHDPRGELLGGAVLAAGLPLLTFLIAWGACHLAGWIHPIAGLALETFWCAQSLAVKGLADEGRAVYGHLVRGDLPGARTAVGRIVGRDTAELDAEGVAKAAVETVAENFSDGVAAPMLAMTLGGAPLALAYKAVNTMDSMIGYRDGGHLWSGRCAAKLDDLAGLLPSRIAALCLTAAAALTGQDAAGAWRIWRRDARAHDSPNAGQTEAACAGALGIRLGGPARYFGTLHDKAYLGDEGRPCVPEDILRAIRMLYAGSWILFAACAAVRWMVVTVA